MNYSMTPRNLSKRRPATSAEGRAGATPVQRTARPRSKEETMMAQELPQALGNQSALQLMGKGQTPGSDAGSKGALAGVNLGPGLQLPVRLAASKPQSGTPAQLQSGASSKPQFGAPAQPQAGAPAQLKRSENPFAWGDDVTSHHIIPHSLLKDVMTRLNKAGEGTAVGTAFLPDYNHLTLYALLNQKSTRILYNGNDILKTSDLPQELAKKPLGTLSDLEKTGLQLKVNGNVMDVDAFGALYANLLAGQSVDGMDDMRDSFYEWQSGNQFYGPERIEPGSSNDFDHDASLVYGKNHTDALYAVYQDLKALKDSKAATAIDDIKTKLLELSVLTKHKEIPDLAPDLWVDIDTAQKEALLRALVPDRDATITNGKAIHKIFILDGLRAIKLQKNDFYPLLSHVKSNRAGEVAVDKPPFSFRAVNKKATGELRLEGFGEVEAVNRNQVKLEDLLLSVKRLYKQAYSLYGLGHEA